MTIAEIRQDLKDIRYYYSMEDLFNAGSKLTPPAAVVEKVNKYSKVVSNAPARLYVLYVSLYVHNNSQIALADDWGFTCDYIKKLNNKLCEFFKQEFEKNN